MRQAGKRSLYVKLSSSQHCKSTKYAGRYSAAETAQHSSRKLEQRVSETTLKSKMKVYVEVLRKRVRTDDGEEIAVLLSKKRVKFSPCLIFVGGLKQRNLNAMKI